MTKLTTERLEELANATTPSVKYVGREMIEMARKLLAYEQAAKNPVAWVATDSEGFPEYNGHNEFSAGCGVGTPLYAAPVLPKQPELVENLKKVMNAWLAMEPKLAFQPEFTDVMMLLDAEPAPAQPVIPEQWRSFVTDADIAALHRFAECCDDPESGGHDLEKEQVRRLEKIGALQRSGRISYTTDFGDYLISATAPVNAQQNEPQNIPAQPVYEHKPSYRDGIIAAAKWVERQREAYDNEHGQHDSDTGSFEFGNDAQRDYSETLAEIAEGIRSLHPASAQPVSEPYKLPDGWKLVPQQIFLDASDIESICSQCGDGHKSGYGDFTDGLLWVGDIQCDNGTIMHGLHISSSDYQEEGGLTLAEFAAPAQDSE